MLTKKQLALIHVAKMQLGLEDDDYRGILARIGVKSSKQLNYDGYLQLLKFFRKLGFKVTGDTKHPKNEPDKAPKREDNSGEFATAKQVRMLSVIWKLNPFVREKTDDALLKFVQRIVKVDSLAWLKKYQVTKIKEAIENIKELKAKGE